ncbi:MAG TPA: zinc ribbon domain-containing protein [Terriglobales bacterium]|nr:zinc ribbon domain-containing protein [Terriglobales bacterium]
MAFCTSCGSTMDQGAKFCPACGTQVPAVATAKPASPAGAAAAAAPSYPAQSYGVQPVGVQPVKGSGSGGGIVKVLLIVFVIVLGLAVLSAAGLFWAAHKVKNAIRVEQSGNSASVQLPGFKATSNTDALKVAQELGVDVYPGASALEGASSVTMGNMIVGNVEFETGDPIDKVEQFYKARFPRSQISTSNEDTSTLVTMTGKGLITITLDRNGSKTHINIARTLGKEHAGSAGDSE